MIFTHELLLGTPMALSSLLVLNQFAHHAMSRL